MIRKILNHSLAVALFALAISTATRAQSVPSGNSPSNATLQRECDDGSFSSCGALGQRYQDDDNASPADMKKGFALFKRACEGGDTISCGDLAQSYLFGKGVAVDERRAAQLSERICKDGNMIGCGLLGIIHQEGQAGYPKNPTTALSYYRKACNESQPRWDFPCKRADALADVASPPTNRAAVSNATGTPSVVARQGDPPVPNPILDQSCRIFPQAGSRFKVYGIDCDQPDHRASAPAHDYGDANLSMLAADAKAVNAIGLRFSIPSNWSQRPSQGNPAIFGGSNTSVAGASYRCAVGLAKPALLDLVRQTINAPQTYGLSFVQSFEGPSATKVSPVNLVVGNVRRGELLGIDYQFSDNSKSQIVPRSLVFVRDFGLRGADVIFVHCQNGVDFTREHLSAGALIASTLAF